MLWEETIFSNCRLRQNDDISVSFYYHSHCGLCWNVFSSACSSINNECHIITGNLWIQSLWTGRTNEVKPSKFTIAIFSKGENYEMKHFLILVKGKNKKIIVMEIDWNSTYKFDNFEMIFFSYDFQKYKENGVEMFLFFFWSTFVSKPKLSEGVRVE